MIEITESWDSIIDRTGNERLRRGRGRCPFCESKTGFSVHEDRGFHCFACGVHGDKISFVQQFHRCDFRDTLRFFGLEPGHPPVPDPKLVRRKKIREGLQRWTRTLERRLRDEFYYRSKIEYHGKHRIQADPDDEIGWNLLSVAYDGIPLEVLEGYLDLLIGKEDQQITAYRLMRKTA